MGSPNHDNWDYLDGDHMSVIDRSKWQMSEAAAMRDTTRKMYDFGRSSLISNQARVVKGGSWRDGAYFLSPGVRRFMDERTATNYIGFRCAMDRVGGPISSK